MFQDENGGPGWGQWPPGPNICSYFRHQHSHRCWQQEAQGPFSWGTCKLWDIRTMENHSAGKRRTHCPQPPAACGTRQRSPTSGRGPDSGIRHSASISRPSGEDQTRGLENRLEAAWGSETGTVGVMRCSLECGVMALSTLVKRCRSVR